MHTSPLDTPGDGDAGGMNVALIGWGTELAARGYTVEIFTRESTRHRPGTVELAERLAVRTLPAEDPSLPKSALTDAVPEFRTNLAEHMGDVDVIHSHYWLSGAAALPIAQARRVPHVSTFHTLAAEKNRTLAANDQPEPEGRIAGEFALVRGSDALTVASDAEARILTEDYDARPGTIHVVSPGVDTHLFVSRDDAPDWLSEASQGRRVVTVLGRIQPLKGQDLVVRALACIPEQDRPLLVLAGGASPGHSDYNSAVLSLAERHGVHVLSTGPLTRHEAARLLAASDVVAVPSRSETFGLVAIEAAACGTPVVGSAGTGLESSVSQAESGLLISSREPLDWALAIRAILVDPALRERLGHGARRHALAHTWAATTDRLERLYDTLTQARPAKGATA